MDVQSNVKRRGQPATFPRVYLNVQSECCDDEAPRVARPGVKLIYNMPTTRSGPLTDNPPSSDTSSVAPCLPKPKRKTPTSWEGLPDELWEDIIQLLSLSDQCAFSLTCHRFQEFLQEFLPDDPLKSLSLPNERIERLKFLYRMYKSFPGKYFCEGCLEYHSDSSIHLPPKENLHIFGSNSIDRERLVKAMDALDNRRDDRFLLLDEIHNQLAPMRGTRWHAEATFKRCGSTILLHISHQVLVDSRMLQQPSIDPIPTCRHIRRPQALEDDVVKVLAACPKPWEDMQWEELNGPIYRCGWCPTEYQVRLLPRPGLEMHIGEHQARYRVCVDRWLDLGHCRSPHSRRWHAHFRNAPPNIRAVVPYEVGPFQNGFSTIKQNFEHAQTDVYVQLLAES